MMVFIENEENLLTINRTNFWEQRVKRRLTGCEFVMLCKFLKWIFYFEQESSEVVITLL